MNEEDDFREVLKILDRYLGAWGCLSILVLVAFKWVLVDARYSLIFFQFALFLILNLTISFFSFKSRRYFESLLARILIIAPLCVMIHYSARGLMDFWYPFALMAVGTSCYAGFRYNSIFNGMLFSALYAVSKSIFFAPLSTEEITQTVSFSGFLVLVSAFLSKLSSSYLTYRAANLSLIQNLTTKEKQLQSEVQAQTAELRASNQELERFAYVASHDLQEPLRMVSSYLGLLDKRYKDKLDDSAKEFIHFAIDGAQRMSKMITSLLDYSRIGRQGTHFFSVSLEEVFRRSLKNLEVRIRDSGSSIELSDYLPNIECDATLLERLFQNIISNGIKFVPKERKPVVKIAIKEQNDQIIFSISDNGIGIPKEDLGNLFQIFKRLKNSGGFDGTGIGLSVCKKIVELHKGNIRVESNEGIGTTFFIELPKYNNSNDLRNVA